MIEFPCLCGNDFSLPDTMAGESFQCPKCLRFVSVPTLDDLAVLNPDGTYNFDPVPADEQRRGANFAPASDSQLVVQVDGKEIGLEEFEALPPIAPRYDPETGELIHAIGVTDVVISAEERARPLPQPAMKSKLLVIHPPPPDAWLTILRQMFWPHNLVVMLAMLAAHIILILIYAITMQGLALFFFAPVIVFMILLSQYASIVQETGPEQVDELPRPLRDFDFTNDIWLPMIQTGAAFSIALGPAVMWYSNVQAGLPRTIGFGLLLTAGLYFLPALLLTASVDGILANFRPDRLWRVAASGKWEYVCTAIAMALGTALLSDSMWGMVCGMEVGFAPPGAVAPPDHWFYFGGLISLALLPPAIYISYYACWLTGLIWRGHHKEFGWIATFEPDPEEAAPSKTAPRAKTR